MLSPLLLSAALSQTATSDGDNLLRYLRNNEIPNSLAIAPDRVLKVNKDSSLKSYGRKLVPIGGINAIVPTKVLAFDDSLSQPPNLYDGLPRETKVLYLLSTLNSGQIALAAGPGIGFDDLKGEARDVFASLVPHSIKWMKYVAGDSVKQNSEVDSGTVRGDELRRVRLQVVRSLDLIVPTDSASRSSTTVSTRMSNGVPGDVVAIRFPDAEEQDPNVLHGVRLRSEVENMPKTSDFATKRFEASVLLGKSTTIGDALVAVSRATGQELVADLRIRGLTVNWNGTYVRACDLLDALALSVGGTYRRIGGAYLLASDLTGAGVRQIRYKAWDESVGGLILRKQLEWRDAIGRSGASERFAYATDDKLAPDPALAAAIDAQARSGEAFPIQSLATTPEIGAFLRREQASDPSRGLQAERFKARSNLVFRFVLPDGTPLQAESAGLGPVDSFRVQTRLERDPDVGRIAPPVSLPPDAPSLPILFRTEDVEESRQAIIESKAHGVREVWLETGSAKVLAEAMRAGLRVWLAVRPWIAPAGTPLTDVDRTALGDDGVALKKRLSVDATFRNEDGSGLTPLRSVEETLAPGTPSWSTRAAHIATLARTPGLSGVIMLNTEPHGYESARDREVFDGFPAPIAAATSLGYSEDARLAFLRKKGVDPIDLGWGLLRGKVDLRPSFFPDDDLAGKQDSPGARPPEGFSRLIGDWDSARSSTNALAIVSLIKLMPSLPIEMEGRSGLINAPDPAIAFVLPVGEEGSLPTFPDGRPTRSTNARMVAPVRIGSAGDFAADMVGRSLGSHARLLPAIDLSTVPATKWAENLDLALARVGS